MSAGSQTTYGELAKMLDNLPMLLREARRQRRLSLRSAAKEIGCVASTVTRFEKGEDCVLSNAVLILHWLRRCQVIDAPQRIQRKRTKGWRMPEGAVYVGRGSRWGNPWRIGDPHPIFGWPMNAFEVVALYRSAIEPHALLLRVIDDSPRGRDIACWCPLDQPCHGDVLLEIANARATP